MTGQVRRHAALTRTISHRAEFIAERKQFSG
jgi:hypothetical protein